MKACGNLTPINIKSTSPHFIPFPTLLPKSLQLTPTPDKDKWINRERVRWSRRFNVPMKDGLPEGFPNLSLLTMRAMCAITVLHPGREGQDVLIKVLDKVLEAYWVRHDKIYEKEGLQTVLEDVLGKEEAGKGIFSLPIIPLVHLHSDINAAQTTNPRS